MEYETSNAVDEQNRICGLRGCGGPVSGDLRGDAAGLSTSRLGLFEPVSLSADDASIKMIMIGTYRGGLFADKSPSEPVHDPSTPNAC